MSRVIRAAAAQFHVGNDVAQNLATCLRIIDAAKAESPDLLVLPEFSNHCSWYDSQEHCFEVSVDLDGEFLGAIGEAARSINSYVVINCTVRRDGGRVTGTSLMFDRAGKLLGTTDKQVLIGHENDFLDRATEPGPVVETELGSLAMYSCMDGVINETPRALALRGAQVLCNSLNSFAVDEGSLHIPVRAAENRVFVVAANKVGPLIPEEVLGPVSAAISIPAERLDGAGDSQIVAPDGAVLALAGKGEEIIAAVIDPELASRKKRRDGTDMFASRRRSLYRALAEDPAGQALPPFEGPDEVAVASIALDNTGSAAIDEAADKIEGAVAAGVRLICLPVLTGSAGLDESGDLARFVERVAPILTDDVFVATAGRSESGFVSVLFGHDGIVIEQSLLHSTDRYGWSDNGDAIASFDSPHGRIAVLASDDAAYPEVVRLAALAGVSTLLVPADFLEHWESETGLVERSAENRVNIVSASHSSSVASGLIATLQRDFTIMTEWKDREFDGLLSAPEVARNPGGTLLGAVHPLAASNKECSRNTHLLASRPWQLIDPIAGA